MALALVVAVVLTGCASGQSYMVPAGGVAHPTLPPTQQAADRAYCIEQARQVAGDSSSQAAESGAKTGFLGALIGAAAGAVLGAVGGRAGTGAALGAIAGGVTGGVGGAAAQAQRTDVHLERQFRACMEAKGYIVR